jgi:hypothetical protein
MPRLGSNFSAASIRPSIPAPTRSSTSMLGGSLEPTREARYFTSERFSSMSCSREIGSKMKGAFTGAIAVAI